MEKKKIVKPAVKPAEKVKKIVTKKEVTPEKPVRKKKVIKEQIPVVEEKPKRKKKEVVEQVIVEKPVRKKKEVTPKPEKEIESVTESDEDSGTISLKVMDSSLDTKEQTTCIMILTKGSMSFSIGADTYSQTFTVTYAPYGQVAQSKLKDVKANSFKITITPTSLQKLLGYMYLTPTNQLDKKLLSIKKDIDKNTKFFEIMDIKSDAGE